MFNEPVNRRQILLIGIAFEGGLFLLSWPLGWLLGQDPLRTWRWTPRDALMGIGACLPMLIGGIIISRWPIGPLIRIGQFFDEVVRPFFHNSTLFDLALISLSAGLGEETLFRGVLQGVFTHWLGTWQGILAVGVLFGLLHPVTLTYSVLAFLASIYLSALWLWTDNLFVVVMTHGWYDFLMLAYLLRAASPVQGPVHSALGDPTIDPGSPGDPDRPHSPGTTNDSLAK